MTIAIYILVGILVLIGLIYLVKICKKEDYNDPFAFKKQNLSLKKEYLNKEELYFYQFVSEHLDKDFIILPKVGVDNIVEPKNMDLKQYNAVKSKYLDFVVFNAKTQEPIFVIDLVEHKASSNNPYFDKDVSNALKMVNLPILVHYVENYYVWDIMKQSFDKFLNPEEKKEEEDKK